MKKNKALVTAIKWAILLVVLAAMYLPLVLIVIYSFSGAKSVGGDFGTFSFANYTKLFADKELIGATVNSLIIGLVSAALAFGLQYYLYTYVVTDIVANYGLGSLAPFMSMAKLLGAAFLGIGLFAGIIASGISVKRYLNA